MTRPDFRSGPSPSWTLTARWVFPVEGPPLPGGAVSIHGQRIAAVEPAGNRRAELDLGDVAVLPGLVNAHTHLDLTGLRGRVPPSTDFAGWLRSVIRHRRAQSPERVEADVRAGLAESIHSGTTLLGDVTAGGQSWDVLAAAPIRALVFHELIGLPADRARQSWQAGRSWVAAHRATATCRPGLSPHAPYSVHRLLYARAIRLARRRGLPVMTHLGESPAEIELLTRRHGPLVDLLSDLGVWYPRGLFGSLDEIVAAHGDLTALFAHGNYLSASASIGPRGSVVYCPRTHAAFGHAPHPFREMLSAGMRVALGTDSVASSPDLDVLSEARFLHSRYPEVAGAVLLRMTTLAGAEALGWEKITGSLAVGKSADLVTVPLRGREASDPHDLIFESAEPVRDVVCRGRWIKGPRSRV